MPPSHRKDESSDCLLTHGRKGAECLYMLKLLPSLSTSARPTPQELYEFGPFRVDAQREILLRAGEPIPLTPKTFQILLVLVRHNQEVVTKDDLMKAVWPDTFVEEANLSRNIFMLRKALGESLQDH